MPSPIRIHPGAVIFAGLFVICGIVFVFTFFIPAGPPCSLKKASIDQKRVKSLDHNSYATPYDDGSSVPFTDLSGSISKTKKEFWASHKASYTCPPNLLSRVGKATGDGGKWMCGLETLGRRSIEDNYNCTLYSFGISRDSAFEAAVLMNTNCFMFGYDPTVNKIGKPLEMSNPRLHFQKVGIAGENKPARKTLKTFMDENGHKFIDILKVDVEGSEYDSLERMFKDFEQLPFGQLLLELHTFVWTPEKVIRVISLVENLERRGARLFSVEPNALAPNCCSEFSFINLNYLGLFMPDKSNHIAIAS